MVTIGEQTFTNELFRGPLSDYVLYLYQEFSVDPLPDTIKAPNKEWQEFIDILYIMNGQKSPTFLPYDLLSKVEVDIDDNKVILALSGGKDSTASLLMLLDEGRDVTSYYCRRANLSYPGEEEITKNICDRLNVPLVIDELHRSGKTDFVENPVKNMVFLSRMIEYGFRNKCGTVQLGEYWDNGNDRINVKYDMSDSIDFIIAFEKAVQTHYPQLKFDIVFESQTTAITFIIQRHLDMLPLMGSCLMPVRYFNRQLTMTLDKFPNLKAHPLSETEQVMPYRCMVCWKCCMEWLYLALLGKIPYDVEFMEQRILPVLIRKMPEIDRRWSEHHDVKKATTEEIINRIINLDMLRKYIKDEESLFEDVRHRY